MAAFETREPDWLSFHEALGRVESIGAALPASPQPIEEALGLAIGEDVIARLTLPPGPTSHMDGYALRARDISPSGDDALSEPLPVVGASRAGAPWLGQLPVGSVIRIMTGALLPAEADTVVPVEETDREKTLPGTVRVSFGSSGSAGHPRGRYVRPLGEELKEGDRLAASGETVTPGLISLLAATGEPTVSVHRAPAVALLVTGDELVPPGDPSALANGIFRADILSPSLPPLISHCGGAPLSPKRVGDDRQALKEALAEAEAEADIIITTGGASMGEADLVKAVLHDMGFQLDFWRVLMRPGSPFSLGRLPESGGGRQVPVLGLPGNPVSALVTFLTLGLPAIRALGGHARRFLPKIQATARERFGGPVALTRFFRVRLDPESSGGCSARLSASQGSGAVRSMASADGLALVPEGTEALEVGDPVQVLLIPHAGWRDTP